MIGFDGAPCMPRQLLAYLRTDHIIESDVDFPGLGSTAHTQHAWRPATRVPFVQPWWATLNPERAGATSDPSTEHAVSIHTAPEALDSAFRLQRSPKDALFERVRDAIGSTECAIASFVSADHPLFRFVELAVGLASPGDDPAGFDSVGFRAATGSDHVLLRLVEAAPVDCDIHLQLTQRVLVST